MIKELRVGVITNSHGLKGEVKVMPTTDDINRFEYLEDVFIYFKGKKISFKIQNIKYQNKFIIVKFHGYDNIDDIMKFKGLDLMVDRENAIKLEDNENFIGDLIGCRVISKDKEEYGKIKDVIFTGANDVYVVSDGKREFMIPVIPQCVLDVDVEHEIVTVQLLPGLLDI